MEARNEEVSSNGVAQSALRVRGVGIRFLAFAIDAIVIGIVFWVFTRIFPSSFSSPCNSIYAGITATIDGRYAFYGLCGFPAVLYFALVFLYYVLFEWLLRGTLGKIVLKLKVANIEGGAISFGMAVSRNVLRLIDFLPFLYLIGAVAVWSSNNKQRIGDRVAKTLVISK